MKNKSQVHKLKRLTTYFWTSQEGINFHLNPNWQQRYNFTKGYWPVGIFQLLILAASVPVHHRNVYGKQKHLRQNVKPAEQGVATFVGTVSLGGVHYFFEQGGSLEKSVPSF